MRPAVSACDELIRLLAPFITDESGRMDDEGVRPGGSGSDPLAAVLADLDEQDASDLLAFFRACCDSEGIKAGRDPAGSDAELVWPRRGQFLVQTRTGQRFIHPDAAGALKRELDSFIKERLLPLDNPEVLEAGLARIRALRSAGRQIIERIARSQELQKRLWIKKKLVLETHYCLTLDRVPRGLYPEIAANDAQRTQWIRLYHIDEIEPSLMEPGYSEPLTVAFLEANPYLMLDTRLFDRGFTDRLLASFEDLDATIDGLLIHADNFHALTLLEPRYRDAIDCIYTDPPYNTGGAGLPYPDRYRRADWLTMVDNRFRLAHRLLKPGGSCFVSIDENEQARLELLLSEIFDPDDFVATFVWEAGRKNDSRLVSISHEYMLCYVKGLGGPAGKGLTWRVRKDGIDAIYRKARLLVRQCGGDYARASMRLRQWLNGLPDNHPARRHKHYHCIDEHGVYHPGNISWPGGGGPTYEVLHPATGRPCKVPSRGWMYPTPERMAEAIRDGLVHFGKDESRVPCAKVYLHANEDHAPNSVFYRDGRAAMKRLRQILGEDCFCNPKDELLIADRIRFSCPRGAGVSPAGKIDKLPAAKAPDAHAPAADATVLDFFAGSGSTAHAVLHLNRSDGGRRRYILVEVGAAFESVLRTRIQRVVYTSKWRQGRPLDRDGCTHAFKYLRLESFDDALLNVKAAGTGTKEGVMTYELCPAGPAEDGKQNAAVAPRFKLRICAEALADPFDCQLRVVEKDGESRLVRVDVIETFNHLLGLRVHRMRTDEAAGIRWVEGASPNEERVLVVWRKLARHAGNDERSLAGWLRARWPNGDEFDLVYVNGPADSGSLRQAGEARDFRQTEEHFTRLMFDATQA